jgi:uncharacterized protein YjbI with pentapeptide repeats
MDATRVVGWLMVLFAAGLLLLGILWIVLRWQSPQISGVSNYERAMLGIEYQRTVISALATAAQIVGGLLLVSGIYFAWRSAKAAEENLMIASEGQVTERFTRATDQLGASEMSRRLGGIYALERIAQDSQKDHLPIMEILASFVRERAPKNLTVDVPDDIQAAMGVLVRRNVRRVGEPSSVGQIDFGTLALNKLNLRGGNFSRLSFVNASLANADFAGADLSQCDFRFANLEGARLDRANIEGTLFDSAKMRGASLIGVRGKGMAYFDSADLSDAKLEGMEIGGYFPFAHLGGASFVGVDLRRSFFNSTRLAATMTDANLEGVRLDAFLSGANFTRANLRGAILYGSVVGTVFDQAHLEDANLEQVDGLTKQQLATAITNSKTILPSYLKTTDQSPKD